MHAINSFLGAGGILIVLVIGIWLIRSGRKSGRK